jgi:hypothetical protein
MYKYAWPTSTDKITGMLQAVYKLLLFVYHVYLGAPNPAGLRCFRNLLAQNMSVNTATEDFTAYCADTRHNDTTTNE